MIKSLNKADYNILSEMLYAMRASRSINQSELASALGVPQSLISKIESGERKIDLIELRHILKFFDISLGEFIAEFERRVDEGRQ